MTNRDKYFKKGNEYDLLTRIHYQTSDQCAIPLITHQDVETLPCLRDDWKPMPCDECLRKWLDKEVER